MFNSTIMDRCVSSCSFYKSSVLSITIYKTFNEKQNRKLDYKSFVIVIAIKIQLIAQPFHSNLAV